MRKLLCLLLLWMPTTALALPTLSGDSVKPEPVELGLYTGTARTVVETLGQFSPQLVRSVERGYLWHIDKLADECHVMQKRKEGRVPDVDRDIFTLGFRKTRYKRRQERAHARVMSIRRVNPKSLYELTRRDTINSLKRVNLIQKTLEDTRRGINERIDAGSFFGLSDLKDQTLSYAALSLVNYVAQPLLDRVHHSIFEGDFATCSAITRGLAKAYKREVR